MRIIDYHGLDTQMSVLDLNTPIELFKETHSEEEYCELMSFYKSDEWQKVERESLNSNRRYYEGRKVIKLPTDNKIVSDKKKFYEPEPFQLRTEEKLCVRFEDIFDDPALRLCVKKLTDKQHSVVEWMCKDRTCQETADQIGHTPNCVSKLKNRALNTIRADYAKAAEQCPDRVTYNIKWYQEYIQKHKKHA